MENTLLETEDDSVVHSYLQPSLLSSYDVDESAGERMEQKPESMASTPETPFTPCASAYCYFY